MALRAHRLLDLHFRRQKPVGPYFADFYCHKARLVVEADGALHREAGHAEYDLARDAYFAACGLAVVRIPNDDI